MRKQKKLKKRAKMTIGLVVTVIIMVVIATIIHFWEKKQYEVEQVESDVVVEAVTDLKTAQFNDVSYIQRRNIETYLLMGVDSNDVVKKAETADTGGRADVQLLLIFDNNAKTWQMLELDRDTLVTIHTQDADGNDTGTKYQQLCLAHIYGYGLDDSCRNTVRTVSELLWGQKIDGYYALNMGGIPAMNDLIGGVEVTITTDFTEVDPTLPLGETITLNGSQAYSFLHERKRADDGTNQARMARQEQYLRSFLKKFAKLDNKSILNAYDTLTDYSVTNMGSGTISKVAEKMQTYTELEVGKLEGTHQIEQEYMTFRLDEMKLGQMIIDLFYEREGK